MNSNSLFLKAIALKLLDGDKIVNFEHMGLKLRITFLDRDYVYEVLDGASINKHTTQVTLLFESEQIVLGKNEKNVWVLLNGPIDLNADLIQALGRSISLRYRM